jgi:molybdenum cofactor biosynthesis enzyme MoaA
VFENALNSRYLSVDTNIHWAGGEPTLLPDFEEVAGMLIANGVNQTIFTNCVVHSPFVEEGLRRKLLRAVISVDSGTPGTFAKIKGRDLFDRVWSTIARYAETNGKVTLKYIVYHNNSSSDDIRNFVSLCKQNGIPKVAVVPENVEFAMRNISEATLRAAALLIHLARGEEILVSPTECFGPAYARRIEDYVAELDT